MLSPRAHADLDQRAHCERISFDGAQRRTRARTAFETRDDAFRRPHSRRDFLLRHARRHACGHKIGHEQLQGAIRREHPRARALTFAIPQAREIAGQDLRALGHADVVAGRGG